MYENSQPPQQNEWFADGALDPNAFQQQPPQNNFPSEPMGMMGGDMNASSAPGQSYADEDYENEPPLLEELGINFKDMIDRTKSTLNPFRSMDKVQHLEDADLTGPIVFALAFSTCLLMRGKLYIGDVYGLFLMGCCAMYVILNLICTNQDGIGFTAVVSIMGYGLLPMVLFAAVGILLNLTGYIGSFLGCVAISWSTWTSARFFEKALKMTEHRYLIAYPVGLYYCAFVLMSMF